MTVFSSHAARHLLSSTRRIDGCGLKACFGIALAVAFQAKLGAVELPPKWETLRPVLEERCYDCHGDGTNKGGVDLKRLEKDPAMVAEYPLWEKVQEVVSEGKMPPKKSDPLTPEEKAKFLNWVGKSLDYVANENSGDPGPVTMRRLTNAEYDYTIRDLTGHDFSLAKDFQADGGGGEGFSNTGDVLFVSPQQLEKYMAAARKLAERASIMPGTGVVFHDQRVGLRGPDQMKAQAEQSLYVWYQHKAEPYLPKDDDNLREADYMLACWKFKYHDLTGVASLEQVAKEMNLNAAFLQNWWNLLNKPEPKSRFLDLTRVPWRELPGPDAAAPKTVPPAVLATLETVEEQRHSWFSKKRKDGSGVQRQQQDADGLRPYGLRLDVSGHKVVHLCIGDDGDGNKGDIALVSEMNVMLGNKSYLRYPDFLRNRLKADQDALQKLKAQPAPPQATTVASVIPSKAPTPAKPAVPALLTAEQLQKRIAETQSVLALFGKHPTAGSPVTPDMLAVSAPRVITLPLPENAKFFNASIRLDLKAPDADFATIQWKLTCDTPPDVTKIMPGFLTVWKRQTEAHRHTMRDFDVMKSAFPDLYERRLEEVARNYLRGTHPGFGVYYFSDEQLLSLLSPAEKKELENMKTDWGYVGPSKLQDKYVAEWDRLLLGHLHDFASRAWRRALTAGEAKQIDDLYAAGRAKELDRESAGREVLMRVLVSPNFIFKAETLPALAAVDSKPQGDLPLSAWELASRLSYFLWASMPDQALRQAAADGSLLKPEVRAAQVKRMLADPKANALAKEYVGQWLGFEEFASHSGVDLKKYPEFTPELRGDFYRETLSFFSHLIREDRPVQDILGAKYTFLNPRLAKYYGIPGVTGSDDEFKQVDVSAYHRGGVLGMGSVLTKTSRPNRTSPVLRGNWLLLAVLGTPVPPPPNNVPKLEEGGAKPTTMREMLQKHRADTACSVCHAKIDPLGFALEDFDPIGRFRTQDDTGAKVDDSAELNGGVHFNGLEGLREFLKSRDSQFTAQLSRKMLGYALGRQVLPTDKALIAQMQQAMKANGGKISAAVLTIVNSRQFLNRRSETAVANNP